MGAEGERALRDRWRPTTLAGGSGSVIGLRASPLAAAASITSLLLLVGCGSTEAAAPTESPGTSAATPEVTAGTTAPTSASGAPTFEPLAEDDYPTTGLCATVALADLNGILQGTADVNSSHTGGALRAAVSGDSSCSLSTVERSKVLIEQVNEGSARAPLFIEEVGNSSPVSVDPAGQFEVFAAGSSAMETIYWVRSDSQLLRISGNDQPRTSSVTTLRPGPFPDAATAGSIAALFLVTR